MSLEVFTLKGKIALITGGGSGIGLGIAREFIGAGAVVIITGRRRDVLENAVQELGNNATFIQNDLKDTGEIPNMVSTIENQVGPIDILVNNAGRHLKKSSLQTTDEEFEDVIKVNLMGVFSLTRACIGRMQKRKKGCVLMISSMTAFFGVDQVLAYGASKASLTGLIYGLVAEHSKDGIRINAIAPGWIESEMFIKAIENDEKRKQKITDRIAMPGFGDPSDIGHAAVFLCSEASKYITGTILRVDGGAAVNL